MTVYVITHKDFSYKYLPQEYKELLVGANGKKNEHHYLTDNTGDNISPKNPSYCELTGLYWIWKNSLSSNVGLVHYRRFFVTTNPNQKMVLLNQLIGKKQIPLSETQLTKLLRGNDWVVAAPQKLEPGQTVWSQFERSHHIKDLKLTRQIIKDTCDDKYLKAFDKVMAQNYLSPYNMFYTKRETVNDYCNWLFDILFKLEKQVDISKYTPYQQRLYGFISERLFNVYLEATAKGKVRYAGVINTQQDSRHDAFTQVVDSTHVLLSYYKHKILK